MGFGNGWKTTRNFHKLPAVNGKRQKQVYAMSELAHIFAAESQAAGRTPSGNCYFEGRQMWSYGSHYLMAVIHGGTAGKAAACLIRSDSYSVTTGKQISDVCSAFHGRSPYFRVPDVNNPKAADNILHLSGKVADAVTELINSRDGNSYNGVSRIVEAAKEFNSYCQIFGIRDSIELPEDFLQEMRQLNDVKLTAAAARREYQKAHQPEIEAAREAAAAKRLADATAKAAEQLTAWRQGAAVSYPYNTYSRDSGDELRIRGEVVETSRGATVPLTEAKRLVEAIRRGDDVEGASIGPYTVSRLETDAIVIGCHRILLATVNELFA
jgi:hypothetical protein